MTHRLEPVLAILLFFIAAVAHADTGYIVLAPDRGFVGNNLARDAFEPFAEEREARLVFVTDERGKPYFRRAVESLSDAGAGRVVLLPLYLTAAHPDFERIEAWRSDVDVGVEKIVLGRPFGQSYLAVRAVADRLAASDAHDGRLVAVGHGASDEANAEAMSEDLGRLAAVAADGRHFDSVQARVPLEDEDLSEALSDLGEHDRVLPLQAGPLYSGMMAYASWLERALPDAVGLIDSELFSHPAVTAWMQREATRYQPVADKRLGVIVHAHGSGFHWNETMRQAAAPLAEDYMLDFAFSMGGAGTLTRAIERLEQRGAEAVVIVRVFSMADSFIGGIERLIGADYESCRPADLGPMHGHGAPASRVLTSLPVETGGGLEDDSLFARALLERARDLSRQPDRETVLLVAHGKGDDEGNARWLDLLDSLRQQMIEQGGDEFRDIEIGTWREDWPDKREQAVGDVREKIEAAKKDGGRVLLVPARTTGQGPARELIPDLEFELGEGFAPHPLFVEWLREQVQQARESIVYATPQAWQCQWPDTQ